MQGTVSLLLWSRHSQKFIVACLLTTQADGSVQKELRTFTTMTQDLLALAMVRGRGGTHVAMESTGPTGVRSTTSWRGLRVARRER